MVIDHLYVNVIVGIFVDDFRYINGFMEHL